MLLETPSLSENFFIKNQSKPVADIFFDLKNEFYANRMEFGEKKSF
jgi:hypothetical protein